MSEDGAERVRKLAAAERGLDETTTYGDCPPPLEWHPYYRGKTWLLDWLNGNSALPQWDIVLPVIARPSIVLTEDPLTIGPSMRTMRMTKRRAWGPAPWVGRPFHYEWHVGTDEVGRHVAGESRIVRESDEWIMQRVGYDFDLFAALTLPTSLSLPLDGMP